MATVLVCGCECGFISSGSPGGHWISTGANPATFSTSIKRSGLRSLQISSTANQCTASLGSGSFSGTVCVVREYIYFQSMPLVDTFVFGVGPVTVPYLGLVYKVSDGKVYAGSHNGSGTVTVDGVTGVSVTTGNFYRIDMRVNVAADPRTVEIKVDNSDLGSTNVSGAASTIDVLSAGTPALNGTYAMNVDDIAVSLTSGDYPLGAGYVISYIPNADGTHNVAGAADFKHGTGTTPAGTDITNATTTAWQNIDKRPLVTSLAGAETLINMIAPPNATDYVEIRFEQSVEPSPPRAVEVIIGINQAATGAGNMEVRLNDNGTMGTIYTATGVAGVAIATGVVFKRAHFADPPSAASAWVLGGAGNGDFNDLRIRFGSPAAVDANPDQYLGEVMLEAEYAEIFSATRKPIIINQARARAAVR